MKVHHNGASVVMLKRNQVYFIEMTFTTTLCGCMSAPAHMEDVRVKLRKHLFSKMENNQSNRALHTAATEGEAGLTFSSCLSTERQSAVAAYLTGILIQLLP